MASLFTHDSFEMTKEMKSALVVSLCLHVGIVVFSIVGLPFISKPPQLLQQPVPIEIVDISEITTTNRAPSQSKLKKIEDQPKPKPEKKIVAPPKVEVKEPPKIKPIEKPKPVEEVKKEEPKKEEPVKAAPVPEKEKPKPPEKKVVEKKPEPKKDTAKEQEDEFLSVLKNLQDSEPETDPNSQSTEKTKPTESPLAKFSQKLSASEIDAIAAALNNQFRSCWNLMAGARNAEDIVVKINLVVRPDRSVQSARIVDQWRYNQDSFYRAAADEAMRAVRHPNCEVLDLPADKYDLWKNLTFNFNPSAQL